MNALPLSSIARRPPSPLYINDMDAPFGRDHLRLEGAVSITRGAVRHPRIKNEKNP